MSESHKKSTKYWKKSFLWMRKKTVEEMKKTKQKKTKKEQKQSNKTERTKYNGQFLRVRGKKISLERYSLHFCDRSNLQHANINTHQCIS